MNHVQARRTATRSLLWWVMRGFWAFLTAVHLWPLAIVTNEFFAAPSLSTGLWLGVVFAVTAVFGLKAVDALVLRFRRPGLEFTTFVIITALIHGDAAAWRSSPALAAETATAIVVAAGGAALGSRRFGQRFTKLLRSLVSRATLLRTRHPFGLVAMAPSSRLDQVWRRCTPARAPPLLVL